MRVALYIPYNLIYLGEVHHIKTSAISILLLMLKWITIFGDKYEHKGSVSVSFSSMHIIRGMIETT